jgi:hypothetical protein
LDVRGVDDTRISRIFVFFGVPYGEADATEADEDEGDADDEVFGNENLGIGRDNWPREPFRGGITGGI